MIGLLIQNLLYGVFGLTVMTAISGLYLAYHFRKGREVNISLPLAALALIASTAPYLGLFGTVWHIIQALSGIGSGNLNVAAIAQPIGEALYATLWGLGCAIPALVVHKSMLYMIPETDESESE